VGVVEVWKTFEIDRENPATQKIIFEIRDFWENGPAPFQIPNGDATVSISHVSIGLDTSMQDQGPILLCKTHYIFLFGVS
jgi:hypothetical protein